jgi:hypothetical protein
MEKETAADYLAKAKDAEGRSHKARDSESKEIWFRVAESYRELARLLSK